MDVPKAAHLHSLALFHAPSPYASRHSLASDTNAYDNDIALPAGYTHCTSCGVLLIPGLTSSCRVIYKKLRNKAPTLRPRSRFLRVSCTVCRHAQVSHSLMNRKRTVLLQNDSTEPKKKKKKKGTSLSSLLAEKRKTQSPSPSLSLFEFMK